MNVQTEPRDVGIAIVGVLDKVDYNPSFVSILMFKLCARSVVTLFW